MYFPQYLVLFNGLVEDWFTDGLGIISYADMLGPRRIGLPIVRLHCEFSAISRMGDDVQLKTAAGAAGQRLAVAGARLLGRRRAARAFAAGVVFTDLNTHRAPSRCRRMCGGHWPHATDKTTTQPRNGPMQRCFFPPAGRARRGYANGVSARGRMIFVAGMIGWDAQGVFHADDLAGQVRQALQNIVEVLAEGGARPAHIVRMTWYVTGQAGLRGSLPGDRRNLPRADR